MEGRGNRRVLTAVVAVVAVFLLSFWFAARYDPIESGSTAIGPSNSTQVPSDSRDENPTSGLRYQDGASGSFAFSIRNSGRWGVTIVDLPILHDEPFYALFDVTRAEVSDSPGTAGPFTPLTPFAPFSLGPGEERLIRLTGTFTDCEWYSPRTTSGYRFIPVQYRFLGLSDVVDVALPFTVAVESPSDDGCPRPRPIPPHQPAPSPTASGTA